MRKNRDFSGLKTQLVESASAVKGAISKHSKKAGHQVGAYLDGNASGLGHTAGTFIGNRASQLIETKNGKYSKHLKKPVQKVLTHATALVVEAGVKVLSQKLKIPTV